jgi:polar amino acid transport system permease protein
MVNVFIELFEDFIFISSGVFYTIGLLVFSLTLGLFLAVFYLPFRKLLPVSYCVNRTISLIRGTPLMLQLCIIYYCGIIENIFLAGILTFGLNSFAYISEIFRSGIAGIPNGQFEAARTLEIPRFHMWKSIIMPQVLRNTLPSIVNETVTLVKESALISIIGGGDIMRFTQIISAQKFIFFKPLLIAGTYYYIIVLFIEYIGEKLYTKINAKDS